MLIVFQGQHCSNFIVLQPVYNVDTSIVGIIITWWKVVFSIFFYVAHYFSLMHCSLDISITTSMFAKWDSYKNGWEQNRRMRLFRKEHWPQPQLNIFLRLIKLQKRENYPFKFFSHESVFLLQFSSPANGLTGNWLFC